MAANGLGLSPQAFTLFFLADLSYNSIRVGSQLDSRQDLLSVAISFPWPTRIGACFRNIIV